MTDNHEQFEATCREEFAQIHGKLDRLDQAIRGNGAPGINRRLDRLENIEAVRDKALWIIIAAVVTIAASALMQLLFTMGRL